MSAVHSALGGAIFDTHTMLPDGTYWKPDIDIKRFTDPSHPDAWQPQGTYAPIVDVTDLPWGHDNGGGPAND